VGNGLENKISNDTTKKWAKNCPKCGCEQIYKSQINLKVSIDNNTLCKSCRNFLNSKKGIGSHSPMLEETKEKIRLKRKFQIITDETKKKISNSMKGENNHFYGKRHSEKTKNNWSLKRKGKQIGKLHPFFGKHHTKESIEKMKSNMPILSGDLNPSRRNEVRKKLRIAAIKRIEKQGFFVSYNKSAREYLDKLNKQSGWNLQHAQNGGEYHIKELGYWVDGYDKKKNIVVEYDEKYHHKPKQKNKDIRRTNEIRQYLNCKFFRYDEKTKELKEII
jgi:hypothetical protein